MRACTVLKLNFWASRLYHVIPHYLINGTNLGEKMLFSIKCMFRFSLRFLSGTFLILRRSERQIWSYMYIDLHVKYPLFLSYYMKLQFSQQIFKKYSNIKFHKNPSSGSRFVWRGWTDRQTDMTKLTIAFCNFANRSKKYTAMSLD